MTEYKHWCGNCQIRIYIQRHEGIVLNWRNCPFTCEYATDMRSQNGVREMKVSEKIEQFQAEIKKLEEKYCDYCQEYSCEDCPIEYKVYRGSE